MVKEDTLRALPALPKAIDALILRDGGGAVLLAAFAGALRDICTRDQVDRLPNHVRKDIGLPPREEIEVFKHLRW